MSKFIVQLKHQGFSSFGKKQSMLLYFLSFIIVALGQPAFINALGSLAASLGIGLFLFSIKELHSSKTRSLATFFWFFFIELIHLSWMSSTKYHGSYILLVYLSVAGWLAFQWVLLNLVFFSSPTMSLAKQFSAASLWVFLEWSRLHVLCGFAFDPVGLSLTWHIFPMQMLSLFGVYGLSFYVIYSNIAFYRWLLNPKISLFVLWVVIVISPYFFGFGYMKYHDLKKERDHQKDYYAAVIQTGLRAEEKIPLKLDLDAFISPYHQWAYIIQSLQKAIHLQPAPLDLIVLPEASVPCGTREMVYQYEDTVSILKKTLSKDVEKAFPPLQDPYAIEDECGRLYVSNAFWSQTLANFFDAECVVGLDDTDPLSGDHYNAAHVFYPKQTKAPERYEKKVLVPLAEYLPFSFLKPIVAKYGIQDFATHGKSTPIFGMRIPFAVSICYEECFGHLMREGKNKGAKIYVNLSNDGWFDPSKLTVQHFLLGRMRAIENGVSVIRSCNTGVTCCVNCFGQVTGRVGRDRAFENLKETMIQKVDLYACNTFYTTVGDYFILGISSCGIFVGVFDFLRKKYRLTNVVDG